MFEESPGPSSVVSNFSHSEESSKAKLSLGQWSFQSSKLTNFEAVLVVDQFSVRMQNASDLQTLIDVKLVFPKCPTQWQVTVVHHKSRNYVLNQISIALHAPKTSPSYHWKRGVISILDSHRQKCLRREDFPHTKRELTAVTPRESIERYLTVIAARKFLSDDKLTIVVEISLEEDSVELHASGCERLDEHVPLTKHFKTMFEEEKFTDVVLNVDGREFRAHRSSLAARSPVFAAMFESNLSESSKGVVHITDVSPEVFELILQFVYKDKVPNMKEMAALVLAAADKYDMKKLKALAQTELCSQLCVENACDILVVADTYNTPYLKDEALQYIAAYATAVSKTDGWQSLITRYPNLLTEAFQNLDVRAKANCSKDVVMDVTPWTLSLQDL